MMATVADGESLGHPNPNCKIKSKLERIGEDVREVNINVKHK